MKIKFISHCKTVVLTGLVVVGMVNTDPSQAAGNTATGVYALESNGPGNYNTATGESALDLNYTGSYNTATGYAALYSNTIAATGTTLGGYTFYSYTNNQGNFNTANGYYSLYSNTSGKFNTASGAQSLAKNTSGYSNTANGYAALYLNTTGYGNNAIGTSALYNNTTGFGNTAVGNSALLSNITGTYNTAIGLNANVVVGNLTNATAIGNSAKATASNMVRIGNTSVTVIAGQVPWTSTSDKRLKNHITDLPLGLDFISRLRPVEYIRNNNEDKTKEWGIIAQELHQTLSDIGYKDAGIVSVDASREKYMSVRYNDLQAPMIKAIQELKQTNQELDKKVKEQQMIIVTMLNRIEALEKK